METKSTNTDSKQKKKPEGSTTKKSPGTVRLTVAEYAQAIGVDRNAVYNRIARLGKGEGRDFPGGVRWQEHHLPTGPHITMIVEKDSPTYERFVKKRA